MLNFIVKVLGGINYMIDNYIEEGYKLMTEYITLNRIKTRNRKFLRKLDKYYNNYASKTEPLTIEEELEYLELEKEFYTSILPESDKSEDKASLELLKILTSKKKEK